MPGVTRSFRHFAGMSIRAHLLPEVPTVRRIVYRFIIGPAVVKSSRSTTRAPLRRIINRVFFVDIFLSPCFFTRRPQPINLYDWSRVVPTRNLRETRLIKFRAERRTGSSFFPSRTLPIPPLIATLRVSFLWNSKNCALFKIDPF